MAFTLREFRSGVWEAWLLFQAVAPIIAFVGGGIAAQHDPYVVEQAGSLGTDSARSCGVACSVCRRAS